MENSVEDADRVRHVGAPVAGTGIDQGILLEKKVIFVGPRG